MPNASPPLYHEPHLPPTRRTRRRPFYGWVAVAVAALAMVATLPGRTIGLGAIAEPVLRDLSLTRSELGTINLIATLIGARFAAGVGRLVDRFGARRVCAAVAAALGAAVLCSARVGGYGSLLVATTLNRGLGQCALSVVSIAVVGKWFRRRVGVAMAVYTVLLSMGFMAAVPGLEYAVHRLGWRAAWGGMGWALLAGFVPLAALLLRSTPESVGLAPDGDAAPREAAGAAGERDASPAASSTPEATGGPGDDLTLGEAVRTATFWALASCGFLFALVFNGFVLFRESILAERGFDAAVVMSAVAALTLAGLVANGVAGWASQRVGMGRVAGGSMALMGVAAASVPLLGTPAHAVACAALLGFAGGGVTVVFFASWGHAFGRAHVGRIQGVAQALTVVGSALGPLALAGSRERFGSYDAAFYAAAPVLVAAGAWAWVLPPRPRPAPALLGAGRLTGAAT